MTTLATRIREISDLERFDIQVLDQNDQPADVKQNGVSRYPFERMAKGSMTVADWKALRFETEYPTYKCKVLTADGTEAHGNTKLDSVRATYEEP